MGNGQQAGDPCRKIYPALHYLHIRLCCSPAHLRLGSAKENALDRIACGRFGKGSSRPCTAFTTAEKAHIAELHLVGVSQYAIAKRMGRAQPVIAYQLAKQKAVLATNIHGKAHSITAAVDELSKTITSYGEPEQKNAA